jgi:hypothetical protein
MPVSWNWVAMPAGSNFEEWLAQERSNEGVASLEGPGSFFLYVGAHSTVIGCWVRWREFLSEPAARQALRAIVIQFSRCIGSRRAIYIPDNAWGPADHALGGGFEGATFEDIRSKLIDEAGPPEGSTQDALEGGDPLRTLGPNCYFIDSFPDGAVVPSWDRTHPAC